MAAGAAACLALVATLYSIVSKPNERLLAQAPAAQVTAVMPTTDLDHAALVQRTAELRDEDLGLWHPEATSYLDDASADVAVELSQQADAEVTVPDWLLAAVSIPPTGNRAEIEEN
jgi:hypothetical protein